MRTLVPNLRTCTQRMFGRKTLLTWRTNRGVAQVRSPDIRPATEDDIRHNAPGLAKTIHQLLRTKIRRKVLNQDKPPRLASCALQQQEPNLYVGLLQSFFPPCLFENALGGHVQWSRRALKTLKLQQAKRRKSLVESGLLGWRRWRGVWHCGKPDRGAIRSREKWSRLNRSH